MSSVHTFNLTFCPLKTHIRAIYELSHRSLIRYLFTFGEPSHYLKQAWYIIIYTSSRKDSGTCNMTGMSVVLQATRLIQFQCDQEFKTLRVFSITQSIAVNCCCYWLNKSFIWANVYEYLADSFIQYIIITLLKICQILFCFVLGRISTIIHL